MDRETELSIIRRAYAKQILFNSGVRDARVEEAYATVRRENFLGPGPWQFFRWLKNYVASPDADPVYLYTDDLIGIVPERFINNGQPSLHAALLAKAGVRPGERVIHVGAGVGYYTAIMAHLVGPTGHVTGIELEADLAARAQANFAGLNNVEIIERDGSVPPLPTADVIYVNAGATHPAPVWLDSLAEGGRLILPLTTEVNLPAGGEDRDKTAAVAARALVAVSRRGAIFRIERRGSEYLAEWISPVMIFPCEGMRDPVAAAALAAGFEKGGWQKVMRLYRTNDIPPEQCWVSAPGWCLAYG
jgi:protein-L-isoaspartate(D-aspartate) O-methyltransferase